MNFLQLKYFKTISQYESITRAADSLFISQPSLSQMLIKLEKELGCSLFTRHKNRLILNEYGEIFLRHVNVILKELEAIENEFNDLRGEQQSTLCIASNNYTLLLSYLMPFLQTHPSIAVEQNLSDRQQLKKALLSERVEFVITNLNLQDDGICTHVIEEDRYVLLVPCSHHLSNREVVTLEDIKNEKFVASQKTADTPRYIDDLFEGSGYFPQIIFQGDTGLQLQMFKALNALKIHLASQVPDDNDCLPIPINHPKARFNITVNWRRKGGSFTEAGILFHDFMMHHFLNKDGLSSAKKQP